MKNLNKNELVEISGGGFAYDVGCAWRYVGNFATGFVYGGGGINGVTFGTVWADINGCPK